MSFERKNLAYIVRKTENKTGELLHILRRMPGSAIIYVRNRRRTKEITELLINEEITADFLPCRVWMMPPRIYVSIAGRQEKAV